MPQCALLIFKKFQPQVQIPEPEQCASGRDNTCCTRMQEKYLKKKTEKYTVRATVERPTARSLAETLFSWRPERIQYMRADTLAMLLTMANIGAHGRALVLDACGGLVTGAVAERMGSFGQVAIPQYPFDRHRLAMSDPSTVRYLRPP